MVQVVNRQSQKHAKTTDNDGSLLPNFQKHITGGMDSVYSISMNPVPPTNSIGSGKQLYFDLERDECGEINDVCLEFDISCTTADVELAPFPYIFDRIIIEAAKGSGDILKTIYPEEFFIWNQITMDEEGRDRWANLSNWCINKKKQEGASERIWINEKTKFRAGKSKKVYLPLPALFFHLDAIDMQQIRSDLRIRLEMANSTNCVVSGDANNLSLDGIKLLVRSFNEESYDKAERQKRQKKFKHKYMYNDVERLQINDKTLTASTITRIPLDNFVGKSGMLVVYIKPSTNPIASDKSIYNYQSLGNNTKFDITNSAGQSLLGNGTAINEQYLNNLFATQTGNPHLEGLYCIPFCEDIKKNFLGKINGVFDFVSVHDYLEITFDDAPTQEVHKVSIGTTASSGTYRLAFENGVMDSGELDYNASTTAIKNALEAMPKCKELDLSVSVDNTMNASLSQNFTFGSKNGRVNEELGKITYIGNGTPKVTSSAITSYGEDGHTTGSNYQINVLMYKFKSLCVDQHGNLSCKDV